MLPALDLEMHCLQTLKLYRAAGYLAHLCSHTAPTVGRRVKLGGKAGMTVSRWWEVVRMRLCCAAARMPTGLRRRDSQDRSAEQNSP